MVASIGELVYVALAKGGITGEHVLIVPVDHVVSPSQLDADTKKEIQTYVLVLILKLIFI